MRFAFLRADGRARTEVFLCRDSVSAPASRSRPSAVEAAFDEQDAFVIFDDVEVPPRFACSSIAIAPVLQQRVPTTSWSPQHPAADG